MKHGADMKWILTAIVGIAGAIVPASGHAEDCLAPCFGYALTGELNGDWIVSADPTSLRGVDIGPNLTGEFWFLAVEHVKLFAEITAEPVTDVEPGGDRFFRDIGAYAGGIYGAFDVEPMMFRVGKFSPVFSMASEQLDGLHATDIAGIFDTDERWSAEANLVFDALGMEQRLTWAAFTTDRTILSQSILTDRGRLRLSDGGAGNTSGISSFVGILDGCWGAAAAECREEGAFGYRLAARYQRQGQRTEEQIDAGEKAYPETAFLAAVTRRVVMDEDLLRLLGELGFLNHAEGGKDDAFVASVSAAYETGPMTYEATYSLQHDLILGEPDQNAHLFDLTATYAFDENTSIAGEKWRLAAGYSFGRSNDGETTHWAGLQLTAELDGVSGHATEPDNGED